MSTPTDHLLLSLSIFLLFFTAQYCILPVGSHTFSEFSLPSKVGLERKNDLTCPQPHQLIYFSPGQWNDLDRATTTCNMSWKKTKFHLALWKWKIRNSGEELIGHTAKEIHTADSHLLKKTQNHHRLEVGTDKQTTNMRAERFINTHKTSTQTICTFKQFFNVESI